MAARAPSRLSHAQRMDRIAEVFRRGGDATATTLKGSPRRGSMMNADSATPPPADTGGLGTPGWFKKARPDSAPKSHRAHSEFSHLHRSLAKGEPIPRAPGMMEQIKGLSQLLVQRPLSQQEAEALRGEEGEDQPDDEPGGTGAQARAEEDDEAFE